MKKKNPIPSADEVSDKLYSLLWLLYAAPFVLIAFVVAYAAGVLPKLLLTAAVDWASYLLLAAGAYMVVAVGYMAKWGYQWATDRPVRSLLALSRLLYVLLAAAALAA